MKICDIDQWKPQGVKSLEGIADNVVRSERNALVVAGPGAGKTELLAQRASYLLDTGTCSNPGRILAISFKRDAAKNLSERVAERCGNAAKRFDSFTLDAFAKNLVDRFRSGLPSRWRPIQGYSVMTSFFKPPEMREWLALNANSVATANFARSLTNDDVRKYFDAICHGYRLPYDSSNIDPRLKFWGEKRWEQQLALPADEESISFPMISRLATLLIEENSKIAKSLRITYDYVFLDEFQDTTPAQYELIKTIFKDTSSVLTAVGDSKQRIMLWAGAMHNVFEVFCDDFGVSVRDELVSNYRSAPKLVQMQQIIAEAVETGATPAEARKEGLEGECKLLEFSRAEDEALYFADLIECEIVSEGREPRDFCVIVRQLSGKMIVHLKSLLAEKGITLRDEQKLQDLLAEPVVQMLLNALRLSVHKRDPLAWDALTNDVAKMFGLERLDENIIEKIVADILCQIRAQIKKGERFDAILEVAFNCIGEDKIRASRPQYRYGSFVNSLIKQLAEALNELLEEGLNYMSAVDAIEGKNTIPAMTIHKSKGLEFHTVIFLGLEDSQWWSFASQPEEEKRSFFVAFSRAIERVFFTYCEHRSTGGWNDDQRKTKISDLYSILRNAGVETKDMRNSSE